MSVTTQEMITAYLNQEIRSDIHTNVVAAHLSQMCLFGIRKGVEFYPAYDPSKKRASKIKRLLKESKLELYLRSIWDKCNCTGSILFYLRPTRDFYELLWFDKSQFQIFYGKDNATLDRIVVCYPYTQADAIGLDIQRWVKLTITAEWIRQGTYDFNPLLGMEGTTQMGGQKEYPGETTVKNTLGIIPCVVVDNEPFAKGQRGVSDFDYLSSQIEALNRAKGAISDNIEMFANPTLITTRPASQVVEATERDEQYRGVATGSGFQNPKAGIASTRKFDYGGGNRGARSRLRIRRIIGSVEPSERIGYITPDPVSGDQATEVSKNEDMIRSALGGVAEFSFHAGATAFEIKSLYGKAAATATRKANGLYTQGICQILELMISAEEFFFVESFRQIAQWDEAKQGTLDEEAVRLYVLGSEDGSVPGNGIPEGVVGLLPEGTRSINWRWTGPVFEDSPADKQQLSITMRNQTEEGIDTIEAFKVLYPDRSDEEINAMLGGVPFRRAQRIIQLIQSLLPLHQTLGAVPLSANPQVSLGQVFGESIEQSIAILIRKLNEELTRGNQTYEPDTTAEFSPGAGAIPDPSTLLGPGVGPGAVLFPGSGGNGAPVLPGAPVQPGAVPDPGTATSAPFGPRSVGPYVAAGYLPGDGSGNVPESGYVFTPGITPSGNASGGPLQPFDYARQQQQFGGGMEGGVSGSQPVYGYSPGGQPQSELANPIVNPGAAIAPNAATKSMGWPSWSAAFPTGAAIFNGVRAAVAPARKRSGTSKRSRR